MQLAAILTIIGLITYIVYDYYQDNLEEKPVEGKLITIGTYILKWEWIDKAKGATKREPTPSIIAMRIGMDDVRKIEVIGNDKYKTPDEVLNEFKKTYFYVDNVIPWLEKTFTNAELLEQGKRNKYFRVTGEGTKLD